MKTVIRCARRVALSGALVFCCAAVPGTNTSPDASGPAPSVPNPPAPATPREFYNFGTDLFKNGKLKEAEAALETALASQREGLQPPSLYNLGHVRFQQGIEQLKKSPAARPAAARARSAADAAAGAVQQADSALASEDLGKMISAYVRGRGVRKELKAAVTAVRRAMEMYGGALQRWERASGDFRGSHELNPADKQAAENADTVDRSIAKLVDSILEMQQMCSRAGAQMEQLKEKMKQLKGKIPEEDMPPGASGDEEEEEEQPKGPQESQSEPAGQEGQEMNISPEQAAWLLEGYKLDKERRLPMGQNSQTEPKDRKRRPW